MELFKPTIAAVHGPCIGYGLTGVLFCDFVIATRSRRSAIPEVAIGVPTIVGAIRLPQRVGWANAMELLLTGKPMNAERAKEIGLVWKLVEPDDLQSEAQAWAGPSPRPRPWPSEPPRRWHGEPRTWAGSSRCASVRPCARWPAPPRMWPRALMHGGRSAAPQWKGR